MCKILALTYHSPEERDDIILSVWRAMSATEKDGFGAAWFSSKGTLAYYKASTPYIPKHAFPSFVDAFGQSCNADAPSDGGFLIIHGRTATCGVNVENTHPMLDGHGSALVHNGIIQSADYSNKHSTCDSELILKAFNAGGMAEVARSVSGYFAFMLLRKVGRSKRLVIAKDDRASLYAGQLYDGYAFATTPALLGTVDAKVLGSVRSLTATEFKSAKVFDSESFTLPEKPTVYTPQFDALADKALGKRYTKADFAREFRYGIK